MPPLHEPRWIAAIGSRPGSRRSVAWIGGAFIAGIVAMAVLDGMRSYQATVDSTSRELEALSRVIAEQTARSLQATDVVLRHLVERYRRGELSALSRDELHLHLQQQALGLVQIDGLVVFDADGSVRAVSLMPPARQPPVNVADTPVFKRLRTQREAGVVIDTATRSPADGTWIFPMLRRLETPSGEFAGAVGARGRIEYFQSFYRDAQPDPHTRIALLHRDGTLIARHPPLESALGQPLPRVAQILASAVSGSLPQRTVSPLDGAERFGAIRLVPDYPMIVVVSRDVSAVLAPWRAQALRSGLHTLALAALAALLLHAMLRQLARLSAARESLEVSQERYALAAAGSDDGIWDWDLQAGTAYESRRARELQGLPLTPETQPLDELRGLLTYHPDDAPIRASAMQAHLEGRTPAYEVEYRVRHADGDYRWIHVRALCIRDAAGKPLRLAGSVSDIDARRRTDEALRRSEERYQLAVEGSNEGLWDWDLASDMLFFSQRAQQLMELEPGEPLRPRREWISRTVVHPDDVRTIRRAIAGHLRGGTPHFSVEFRLQHRCGQWRWYRQRGVALRGADGRPYRVAGSMEDITERKEAEAQRDRLEQQLRQAQKLEAIGTLAGGIAHDFNNILSAILGYGEMVQRDADEGTRLRRHIDASMGAALRAKSLVERILAFSRGGTGARVPVHVQSVVEEALDGITAALPAGVRLVRSLHAGDAGVLGDATQIHQVVMNLCANAVHAMKSEGTLSVTLADVTLDAPRPVATSTLPAGRYLCMAIADTGSGIAPAVLERIFDPFFTTKEVGVGTGLGLSLVHGIVTDLDGGIAVDSRPGHETTFTVYLPWHSPVGAAAAVEEHIVRGEGETVLLVDDEEALVRLGEEMLAELGYEPVGFASSVAALEAFRAEPDRFDAVLSDESMPAMSGCELALAIRALRPSVPVVLMSGYVSPALTASAREIGVVEVIAKPLVSRDIARGLAAALGAVGDHDREPVRPRSIA